MNSQSATQTDADEQATSSPCEESSNTGADAKTSSKIVKSYRTKRLFFHFEIGVTSRRQPEFGVDPNTPQSVRHPVLVGTPKPQALAHSQGAAALAHGQGAAAQAHGQAAAALAHSQGAAGTNSPTPSSAAGGAPSYNGRSVYVDVSAGVTDMPPPNPLGPPRM